MTSPLFCDNCPRLALAVLDGSPLCRVCLIDEIAGRDGAWVREHVTALGPGGDPLKAVSPNPTDETDNKVA